jgi:D-arabinose 1-dehydrogenase-like Zn-dependent alcohol dehydrogenase
MTRTMKAAVVREFARPLIIEEVPVPTPGHGQILVKIAATGVCHTDLHAANGDWPVKPKPPFIPGHEGVGHVVAVGAGVSHVKEGDRVGVPWLYTACGHCKHCLGGWETLARRPQYRRWCALVDCFKKRRKTAAACQSARRAAWRSDCPLSWHTCGGARKMATVRRRG